MKKNPRSEIRFIVNPGMTREKVIKDWLAPSIEAFVDHCIDFENDVTVSPIQVFSLILTRKEYKPS